MESRLGKTTPSSPERDSNLDLPVLSSLRSSNYAIKAAGCSAQDCVESISKASGTKAPATFCKGDLIFDEEFDVFDVTTWDHELTLAGGGGIPDLPQDPSAELVFQVPTRIPHISAIYCLSSPRGCLRYHLHFNPSTYSETSATEYHWCLSQCHCVIIIIVTVVSSVVLYLTPFFLIRRSSGHTPRMTIRASVATVRSEDAEWLNEEALQKPIEGTEKSDIRVSHLSMQTTTWDSNHDLHQSSANTRPDETDTSVLTPRNWEFEVYTNNRSNTFAQDGSLHIRPTLTSDHYGEEFLSSGTISLLGGAPADACTNPSNYGCERTGSVTNLLNPAQSARIRSLNSFSFRYGKVEIRARMPSGDWLWPALWLLPRYNAYSTWPASGEIDLAELRGNLDYVQNGVNIGTEQSSSTLHFGPYWPLNAYESAHFSKNTPAGAGFDKDYHLYQMEWTSDYLKFSLDNEELGTVTPNDQGFWGLGGFSAINPTAENPWRFGTKMAPFDQEFYFLMNLAVGGVNGYFPDDGVNAGGKPWINTSPQKGTRQHLATSSEHRPDTDGEHVEDGLALDPAQDHDQPNDAEGVERKLGPQDVHTLLERGLGCLLRLHHLEHLTKLRLLPRVNHDALLPKQSLD
uniref:GH16 domain-containing protein n=1 Tax=Timema tahoe TaxID=61484 RepID=A0A7R9FHP6_9NEOP|nr:unnamed protein product [Timema tahoe]